MLINIQNNTDALKRVQPMVVPPYVHYKWNAERSSMQIFTNTARPSRMVVTRGGVNEISSAAVNFYLRTTINDNDFDTIFLNDIFSAHPNSSADLHQWQCVNYPYRYANDIISQAEAKNIAAVFQDGEYKAQYTDAELNEYIAQPIFEGLSLIEWAKKVLPTYLRDDPNGFIAVIKTKQTNASIIYLPSYCLTHRDITAGAYRFWYNGMEYVFDSKTVTIIDYSKETDNLLTYDHFCTFAPLIQLGGIVQNYGINAIYSIADCPNQPQMYASLTNSGKGNNYGSNYYYRSIYSSGLGAIADAIKSYLDWQSVKALVAYPIKQETMPLCPKCDGEGMLKTANAHGERNECNVCKGTGVLTLTAGHKIAVNELQLDNNKTDVERIKYYGLDAAAAQEPLYQQYKAAHATALASYNLLTVDAGQSGIAKTIDLQSQVKGIDAFAGLVFTNLRSIFGNLACQLLNDSAARGLVELSQPNPSRYANIGADELKADYLELVKAKADPQLIAFAYDSYLRAVTSNDPVEMKKSDLITLLDPLRFHDNSEVLSGYGAGVISEEDYFTHLRAAGIVNDIVEAYGNARFLATDTATLLTELDKMIGSEFEELNMPKGGMFADADANTDQQNTDIYNNLP